jgi:hypothetical protein
MAAKPANSTRTLKQRHSGTAAPSSATSTVPIIRRWPTLSLPEPTEAQIDEYRRLGVIQVNAVVEPGELKRLVA